jgi:hypothetical protein
MNNDLTGEVVAANIVSLSVLVDGLVSFCAWRKGDKARKSRYNHFLVICSFKFDNPFVISILPYLDY